ncbi:adenylate kinase-like kinase [Terriglobus roseus DSM 18391]|uniref:Adenylate kinase-like kinase n=1 Tax=Terriglobus roseus (strain DSM 18391 / NRRL B-41598 / KBS 63) TaxID=926566 RepID=I3ZKG4_TERRK|nr:adenylate kinase-like kinase [Terriglobus roseus DSM 18391]
MHLSELGDRICVLGPSNSGKSTLAEAIARKRGLSAVHLDQLHHLPHTNWKPRPPADFVALHDAAIANDRWVIDGNYSKLFPQRFQRATGLILLDISTAASLFRYVRRTIFHHGRVGGLQGGIDSIKWTMLHHIAIVTPGNRRRYAEVYRQLQLPRVFLPSIRAIDACYQEWELERPRLRQPVRESQFLQ